MTRVDFNQDSLILPKIIDLSNNLQSIPFKKTLKILKIQEGLISEKQNLIKNKKLKIKTFSQRPHSINNYSITSINDIVSDETYSNKKIYDDYVNNKTKENKKMKYKYMLNPKYPIRLKKIKPMIKEEIITFPIKINTKLFYRNRNFFNSKISSTEQTKNSYNSNKLILELTKFKLKEEENDYDENYDSFQDRNINDYNLLKVITNFLRSKDNKLNQISIEKEKFYNSFENRINFIYDIIGVPCFKNHFIKIIPNKDLIVENISNNLVESGIHYYLNKLRVRYQRELDEKEEKRKLELIKEEHIRNLKAKKEKEKMDEFDNAEQAFKTDVKQIIIQEIKKDIDYEIEDFFSLKYIRYDNVHFSGEKEKTAIQKFKIEKKSKYRYSILKKIL
jgi:hypothetical protein